MLHMQGVVTTAFLLYPVVFVLLPGSCVGIPTLKLHVRSERVLQVGAARVRVYGSRSTAKEM
jgi:hypothetical protein